ncbi:hypothetical protein SAMN05192534_12456 [Alteribacillus persepolensis]|uniref:Phage tail assembly chaperone protein, E, or 41 or 14 n=1 Tax=Alteribacillus persepolensis TaxID=568899 RepID=A0A1G8IKK8_9BACI|nr:hypothetical protein [Alteribacillus persepolensis]SDI19331.1 hypothetical protein SAMN05192534_12456 [Alteribacillus persepolensis]
MEITLHLNGEDKTFTIPFVNTLILRKTLEIKKEIDFTKAITDEEDLDKIADFLVFAFKNQFSREDVFEGLPGGELLTKMDDVMAEAMGLNKQIDEEPQGKN